MTNFKQAATDDPHKRVRMFSAGGLVRKTQIKIGLTDAHRCEVITMNRGLSICAVALLFLFVPISRTGAQQKEPLRLVQTIPMPNVKGRIDHMDIDVKGKRLFVAGLENGSLEVVDLQAGKWLRSIPGFKKTQGIAYVSSLNKVFVASGDDGMLRVFRGDSLDLLDAIKLDLGPNRVAYDPHSQLLYVGYGGKDAGKDYGEVGIIDAKTDKHLGDVKVEAHPSELLLDQSGKTLFVFVSIASKVQVLDTKKREVVSTWPLSSQRNGDGALDEKKHRLFVGTRTPPQMLVMNSQTGKEVANLPTVEGMDGVYFDPRLKRIYISGGRDYDVGYVFAYQQKDSDRYETLGKIPTKSGAGTSFWCPELNRYYVAAPAHDNEDAAILVFEPQP
jgi:DNA-binding beta-propeller fold protein YncE